GSTQVGPPNAGQLGAYMPLLQLLPYYQQYLPDEAVGITARFADLISAIPDGRKRELLRNLFAPSAPADVLSNPDFSKDARQKDLLYMRAATKAADDGDFDKALAVTNQIQEEQFRQRIESTVRYRAAMARLAKNDIDAAYQYAAGIPSLESRAPLVAHMIATLLAAKNTARASEMLNDAERGFEKVANSPQKAGALLTLAEAAARFDTIRSFEILKSAVGSINHAGLEATLPTFGTPAPGNGAEGRVPKAVLPTPGTLNLQRGFGPLARTDFDGALWLAQEIEKKDISLMAQLAVCRGVLAVPSQQPTKQTKGEEAPGQSGHSHTPPKPVVPVPMRQR
ncbi:MAG TPA: hypothetical protein VJX67_02260, partial [Blastocatellia bacterium]|nr:hypothetical protein [Blastocatellia bacterium]